MSAWPATIASMLFARISSRWRATATPRSHTTGRRLDGRAASRNGITSPRRPLDLRPNASERAHFTPDSTLPDQLDQTLFLHVSQLEARGELPPVRRQPLEHGLRELL